MKPTYKIWTVILTTRALSTDFVLFNIYVGNYNPFVSTTPILLPNR